jgi:hypothetical protein
LHREDSEPRKLVNFTFSATKYSDKFAKFAVNFAITQAVYVSNDLVRLTKYHSITIFMLRHVCLHRGDSKPRRVVKCTFSSTKFTS